MIIYVAHNFGGKFENFERAKKITHDLQKADMENCYICPILALSHLSYGEVDIDREMELCIDLMSVCDKMIVAGDTISAGVKRELEFAKLVGMEIEFLEKDRLFRHFEDRVGKHN